MKPKFERRRIGRRRFMFPLVFLAVLIYYSLGDGSQSSALVMYPSLESLVFSQNVTTAVPATSLGSMAVATPPELRRRWDTGSTQAPQPSYARSKHLSVEKSLEILTSLNHLKDKYADGKIRCAGNETFQVPRLFWYDYSGLQQHVKNSTRRVLMVQSAGFGTYAQLLDLTAPVNKAYARRWSQDMLVLQGTLVVLKHEYETNCIPLERRSTHNKMQLLRFALELRHHYDYLLILDADAMMFDFGRDLGKLMPDSHMLAAQRVVAKKGVKKRATWKINAGVTLWNLHHPYTREVADQWQNNAVGYLNSWNNWSGDQIFLFHALKSNSTYEAAVYSFAKEFNYNKGTVIRHIKRPKLSYETGETDLDGRSRTILKFTNLICERFPDDCRGMDNTEYSAL